ncbi:hypothetical protein B0H14DRAFT_1103779 [Mycena olivaceomarginata]|nr:hypothetical protein B0H14DRAFT_1103779 [Mycena olivaceomarginata]
MGLNNRRKSRALVRGCRPPCCHSSLSLNFLVLPRMSDGNSTRDGHSTRDTNSSRGDIGTSYPSPVSAAASPNLEGAEQPRPDTQHSLRVASAALQAAYRRIRQVRRSLVELAEPLPLSPDSLTGDIGPAHAGLVLTSSPVEESSDNDEAIDFQRIQANLAAIDRQTQEYLDRFAPGSWGEQQAPSNGDLPTSRRHMQLPSAEQQPQPAIRRSMLESQLARRRELYSPDDSATFLGRRVAAREAAGPSRAAAAADTPPMDPIVRAMEMERELLHLRAMNHQRRTDPGIAAASRADALSRAEIIRAARSLDMESFRAGHRQPSTNVPIHRPPPNPRRWRAYREARQNSSNTQSPASAHPDGRLSMLSNFSVQNLPTPTSAIARDRPLLFEEPLSYTGQRRESADVVDSPIGSDRSYFIHRRVNADGDELVHNINLEWDDEDPLSWLMSPRERGESLDYAAYPRRRYPGGPSSFYAGSYHERGEPRPARAAAAGTAPARVGAPRPRRERHPLGRRGGAGALARGVPHPRALPGARVRGRGDLPRGAPRAQRRRRPPRGAPPRAPGRGAPRHADAQRGRPPRARGGVAARAAQLARPRGGVRGPGAGAAARGLRDGDGLGAGGGQPGAAARALFRGRGVRRRRAGGAVLRLGRAVCGGPAAGSAGGDGGGLARELLVEGRPPAEA